MEALASSLTVAIASLAFWALDLHAHQLHAYQEVAMKGIVGAIVVIWLVIGAVAAYQRGYFTDERDVTCRTAADTLLTVAAGPLNYMGANPKVDCDVPEPSE